MRVEKRGWKWQEGDWPDVILGAFAMLIALAFVVVMAWFTWQEPMTLPVMAVLLFIAWGLSG